MATRSPTHASSPVFPKMNSKFFEGMGYKPYFVEGREPRAFISNWRECWTRPATEIKQIWSAARAKGVEKRRFGR